MTALVDIFSLLTAVAGWHYLFYSRAAQRLEGLEVRRINRRRVLLRRVNGGVMLLLAVLFFAGSQVRAPATFVIVWDGVMVLLVAIIVLAMVDVRLTWKLRAHRPESLP